MTASIPATMERTGNTAPAMPWPAAQTYADLPDLGNVMRMIETQRARIAELERLATHDELTGLANRRGLTRALEAEIDRIGRAQSPSALLVLIDLTDFKRINDTFGHEAGDSALRLVATTLLGFIRTTDHAARLGGDEFVVLLTHATRAQLDRRLTQLDDILNSLVLHWKGTNVPLHAALGCAVLNSVSTPDSAIEQADAAMYAVKRQRKGGLA